ncbi:YphA family membrane protein [Virgibacillus litoralis]|uniref:Integral membrane protein n=1 Tax=Virgibacillus litoralis TaxID=578221 RepID=A0ABS4HFE8_9BACI|nr:hypothetical protein [Virgibacillus litoralis]
MGSGLIFYWFCWVIWIVVTFFMKKDKRRAFLACWILLLILFSNLHFSINFYQISVSFLVFLGGTLLLHVKLPRLIFHSLISFIVSIGYIGMVICINITPLRLFFPQLITISLFLVILIMLLTNGLLNRLGTGLFGIACGEIVYSMIMADYSIPKTVGDMEFFDCVLIVTAILLCNSLLLTLNRKIYILISITRHSIRQRA